MRQVSCIHPLVVGAESRKYLEALGNSNAWEETTSTVAGAISHEQVTVANQESQELGPWEC